MAARRNPLDLLPPGVDPYEAEAAVQEYWMRSFSAELTAYKAGLPLTYVVLICDRLRAKFRGLGVDFKRDRAERLLAMNQEMRALLYDRIKAAPDGQFSLADLKELRELLFLEMRQLGLLAPKTFQPVETARTYDELVELCKQAGIPVPGDHYGPDPDLVATPPAMDPPG